MFILGLCGGSGSGKSLVAAFFKEIGYSVFDADYEYHKLIDSDSACTREIADAFGKNILNDNGSIHRCRLADIVFSASDEANDKRILLNRIAHKHVHLSFQAFLSRTTSPVLLDAPLLFEAGMDTLCNATLAITAPKDIRIARITARDGISVDAAEKRIKSQIPDEELKRRCTYHIENNSTITDLKCKTIQIINHIASKGALT